ncbi:MAG TPA: ABC-2 transporter permease [Clostridiaceae bacterium]|nr:ABC-2 transporter permease [Clostridiaceae bacterium]
MKALLLKEWLVIWKQGKFMILLALVYSIIAVTGSGSFFAGFSVIFMSMLPITVMGLDERSKWDHYAVTMPYSRKDIVLSKYAFSTLCAFTAIIVYVIATIIKLLVVKHPFDFSGLINQAILMLSIGLFFSSVNLPIMFKFGVDKGRMWFILITVIIAGGISSLFTFIGAESAQTQIESLIQRQTPFMLFVISAGLLLLSALLSIKIYEKREL